MSLRPSSTCKCAERSWSWATKETRKSGACRKRSCQAGWRRRSWPNKRPSGRGGGRRTNRIFGFDYVHENYLPPNKRKFGSYVLPILWGDRFIGRIDPRMDRENERLLINSVHAEPGAPGGKDVSLEIRETIGHLAEFLGAKEVVYTPRVPKAWSNSLR